MSFDFLNRPRRLRENKILRDMISENSLSVNDLIFPVFISSDDSGSKEISSMPGIFRWSLDALENQMPKWLELGIRSFAIFPCVAESKKDDLGSEILNPKALSYQAAGLIKSKWDDTLLVADIALDPYTKHGHDGVLDEQGCISNDPTVEILAKASVVAAESGYDLVAPSDMMDGRVSIIRKYLDSSSFYHVGIMAYSAKFCSAYYGPFREAIGSSTAKPIDKSTYQLNPANKTEAERELLLDAAEGADILMVKPAEPYLDIIMHAKNHHCLPVAAYQVSGEYSRLWAASSLGWLDLDECAKESLLSIKRAGADLILTYFAERIAPQL